MKPWKTDTQNLVPDFTIFMNKTRINVEPWNNFKRKEFKITFFPSLTQTFNICSFLCNYNTFTLTRAQDTFLQRIAYIKNMFITFYTCAITLSLMCNFSIKPLNRIVQKRRKNGKNAEINYQLIRGVGIWKLVESLLRWDTNFWSCLYVIKKEELWWDSSLQSTNSLDGHRGIQIKQLAAKQDIDLKLAKALREHKGLILINYLCATAENK